MIRTLKPNASHSQAAAPRTSGEGSSGMTGHCGMERLAIISLPCVNPHQSSAPTQPIFSTDNFKQSLRGRGPGNSENPETFETLKLWIPKFPLDIQFM